MFRRAGPLALTFALAACASAPEPVAPRPPADPYLAALGDVRDPGASRERLRAWFLRLTSAPSASEPQSFWLGEGVGDFLALRARARAGALTADEAAAELNGALRQHDAAPAAALHERALLLALKWDEEIRRKGAGQDLDDLVKAAFDRQALVPTETTGLTDRILNAAWGSAQLNLRDDVARHVVGRERVPLPDTLFGDCLFVRTTLTQAFDSGFDHKGSAAAGVVRGVRRGGPAWTSGVRNGTRIQALQLAEGDTSREVELRVTDSRGRKRTLRYWPYGDEDRTVRTIVTRSSLSDAQLAACARAIAGL